MNLGDATFSQLLTNLNRVSHEQFAIDFGGIDRDIVAMLRSPKAQKLRTGLRLKIENSGTIDPGYPRLQQLKFGDVSSAPELLAGQVAAIDGANVLPLQQYSIGQAVCVAVGSVSHTRPLANALHYWSTKLDLDEVKTPKEFFKVEQEYLFGINPTALLRYLETQHALEIDEPYVFLDGPIIYEWLGGQTIGIELYKELLKTKKVIGILKNLGTTKELAIYGSVLKSGELYIHETTEEHLSKHNVHMAGDFLATHCRYLYRGVFKPALTPFGFEVHKDILPNMMALVAADCALEHIGHEIPYLLDTVDKEVRIASPVDLLKNQIAASMHMESEELFFQNSDEFDFR
jgi:hypothetical protein